MSKHTDLPWVQGNDHIRGPKNDEDGDPVIIVKGRGFSRSCTRPPKHEERENFELITRAVNNHQALVEALQKSVERLEEARQFALDMAAQHFLDGAADLLAARFDNTINPAKEALAKATGDAS